jgi:FkbM family methyltransferase
MQLPDGHGLWLALPGYPNTMANLGYEPALVATLCNVLRPSDAFLDVGANAGYFSLIAKSLVGPSGRVIAFEPDPRNCAALRRISRSNPRLPFEIVEAAIGPINGPSEFLITRNRANSRLASTTWAGAKEPVASCRVPAITLSAVLPPGRCVVKLDCEGAEAAVLAEVRDSGALQRLPVVFLVETHGEHAHSEVSQILAQLGYTTTNLDETMVIASLAGI